VIPDSCSFVVDVRVNELYTLEQVMSILQKSCESKLKPRSLRNRPSVIALDHAAVQAVQQLGLETFGSATLSDQVHFNCPSIKIGCGDSRRSHQADEYIELNEMVQGIDAYINLLEALTQQCIPKFSLKSITQ
jgi:acetylornithine deacetylase